MKERVENSIQTQSDVKENLLSCELQDTSSLLISEKVSKNENINYNDYPYTKVTPVRRSTNEEMTHKSVRWKNDIENLTEKSTYQGRDTHS